ncbi:MAG: MBL fold metallo-hydrolase [Gaiellaceae bacterium]
MLSRDDIAVHLAADVAYGETRAPVFVHTIEHAEGLVLVDTGLLEPHPAAARWDPRPHPLPAALVRRVAVVVNTHLHFDHCGGNRLFPGVPIHVQARELADARGAGDDDTIRDWVDVLGSTYVEHEGEAEILPGVRLLPTPGHTAGHQSVVVETDSGSVVLGGDVAYSFRDLGRGDTEGRRRVLALGALTYLAHVERPKVPEHRP